MSLTSIHLRPLPTLVALVLLLFISFSALGKLVNDIIYVYDEAGRLVAVIDPLGDTATYRYDSVGNILSISRYNSTMVSIVEFTPNSGPTGTTVTIYGTGFSTNSSQNTVSFNGVTTSVISSTFSQIVTTVPATATTGPITVTTPAGTVVSADSFVIHQSAGPTITSFSPTIGTPATAVTITGTNFETTASRNRLKFNTTIAASGTATGTTIDTTVPSSTSSGRIRIETTAGAATSSADFFIPPSPYTAADVLVTDRMTLGDGRTVAMSISNKIGMVLFDAIEGQRASVKLNTSTIAGGAITIYSPKGVVLGSASFNTTSGYVDTPLLTSGTHTIVIDPSGSNTGNINFTLNDASDLLATLAIGDPTTAFATTTPGQNARITFNGTTGQRINLGITGVTIGSTVCCNAFISLASKTGFVVQTPMEFGTAGGATNTLTLPVTGAYTILVDPQATNIGSISLTLTEELAGTMTIGGPSQNLTFRYGQNARLTFNGIAGQRVSLGMSSVTIGAPTAGDVASVTIYNPNQTVLLGPEGFETTGDGTVTSVLPVSGTYSIAVDPYQTKIGDVTLTLSEELSGTILINGSTVPLTFTYGQNARLTFDGIAGQRVSVGLSDVTVGLGFCCDVGSVAVQTSDGSTILSPVAFTTAGQGTPSFILPASGSYAILINPYIARTGSLTVTLSEDIQEPITINGSSVPLALSRVGQNALLTFSATAGQRISLGMSGVTIGVPFCCTVADVSILKPDGTTLLSPFAFTPSGAGTNTIAIPTTGTYSIIMNPQLARTGNVTVTLSEELAGSISINGAAVLLTFRAGQNALLTFAGLAGQRVSVGTTDVTIAAGSCCNVGSAGINKPDGTVLLAPDTFTTTGDGTASVVLPTAGTYSIVLNPIDAFSGNATVTLSEDVSGSITIDGAAVPLTFRAGQNGSLTFTGVAGQRVSIAVTGVTIGTGTCCNVGDVSINKPDGSVLLAAMSFSLIGKGSASVVLPVSGTYSIPVNPQQGFGGDVSLTLSEDISNTTTINGATVPLSLSRVGQNAVVTFSGTSGALVTVRITGNTFVSNTVMLLNPNGTVLTSATSGFASFNLTQKTLPATGTYSIAVDPLTLASGNITVAVTTP